jgi:nucleolar GTP-binding protein
LAQKIRDRKIINRNESRISRQSSKPTTPRTAPAKARGRSATDFRSRMEDLGVDMEDTENVIIYFSLIFCWNQLCKLYFILE